MIWNALEKGRHRKLAEARPPVSAETFVQELIRAGAQSETATFVHEQFSAYYFPPLSPVPTDRVGSTLRIDPEDVEEVAELFCEAFSVPLPSRKEPVTLPADPTLLELALFLDRYRDGKSSS